MPQPVLVKSQRSTTRAFVRFINKTQRTVQITWLDFHGNPIPYRTLKPNEYVDVDTYINHAWIFVDVKTKDRMCAQRHKIFYAEPWYQPLQSNERRPAVNLRVCVAIHLPLYSLRMCGLLKVRDLLNSLELIDLLELPAEIKRDLHEISTGDVS